MGIAKEYVISCFLFCSSLSDYLVSSANPFSAKVDFCRHFGQNQTIIVTSCDKIVGLCWSSLKASKNGQFITAFRYHED